MTRSIEAPSREFEPETLSAMGMQQAWANLSANPSQQYIDHVGIGVVTTLVDVLAKLAATDDPTRVMHEIVQDSRLLGGQRQRRAVQREATGIEVQDQATAAQYRMRMPGRTTNQRTYSQHHFLKLKRLGEVVIGTGIEACELVVEAATRGQHEHRKAQALLAPAVQHTDTVKSRQTKIEHGGVEGLGGAAKLRVAAICAVLRRKARFSQHGAQTCGKLSIVLGHQHAHQSSRSMSVMRPVRASYSSSHTTPYSSSTSISYSSSSRSTFTTWPGLRRSASAISVSSGT